VDPSWTPPPLCEFKIKKLDEDDRESRVKIILVEEPLGKRPIGNQKRK
jgi:hypothetical protein